mgnify:CR=1
MHVQTIQPENVVRKQWELHKLTSRKWRKNVHKTPPRDDTVTVDELSQTISTSLKSICDSNYSGDKHFACLFSWVTLRLLFEVRLFLDWLDEILAHMCQLRFFNVVFYIFNFYSSLFFVSSFKREWFCQK